MILKRLKSIWKKYLPTSKLFGPNLRDLQISKASFLKRVKLCPSKMWSGRMKMLRNGSTN